MSGSTHTKPTIIIVPGSWIRPPLYEPLAAPLRRAGYEVHILDLPSNGDPPSFAPDWQPDIKTIASAVEFHADQGKDIVLVPHSAGGGSSTEAVRGLSKANRQELGKAGGIQRLVYLAAFAPDLGVSPIPHEEVRKIYWWAPVEGEIDYPRPDLVADILFTGLPPEEVDKYLPSVQKSAWRARQSAYTDVTHAGWKHIPSSYLICTRDKAVVPELQEMMAAQEGSKFDDVVRLDAAHFPFITHPEFVSKFVRRAAGETDVVLEE